MLRIIAAFIRSIVAKIETERRYVGHSAVKNLMGYLNRYIRPELLEKIKIENLLVPLVSRARALVDFDIDGDLFLEDLVDMFIDERGPGKLQGRLLRQFEDDEKLSEDDADKLVSPGALSGDLKAKMPPLVTKYTKIIAEYLSQFFVRRMQKWVAVKRTREQRPLDEKELDLEKVDLDNPAYDEDLDKEISDIDPNIEKIFKRPEEDEIDEMKKFVIQRVSDKAKQDIFKKLIDDYLTKAKTDADRKKSLESLAKDLNTSLSTLSVRKDELVSILKDFVKSKRHPDELSMGEKYFGPEFLKKVDVPIPKYKIFIKDHPDEKEDLKEFIFDNVGSEERAGRTLAENVRKAIEGFVDGKTDGEIAVELKIDKPLKGVGGAEHYVRTQRARYFTPYFKEWFREWEKEQKRSKKAGALRVASKFIWRTLCGV